MYAYMHYHMDVFVLILFDLGREIDRGYARHHWRRRDRSFLLAGHFSGYELGRTSPGYRAPEEGTNYMSVIQQR